MSKTKMQQIWEQMRKNYGNDGLCTVKEIETITTGSYTLDDALGVWGLPKGRIIQYAGKESCGKTLMSLIAIREWQKLNPENWAVFIDAEYSYSESWARKLGVDTDRIFLIKENNGIEIFNQLCGIPSKEMGKPKAKAGILDLERENPSGLGIIVLDSVAAMETPIASTKEVGNTNIAPMGRFLPDALVRLTPLLAQTGVVFIAINQVRVDVGKMFGDPTSTPGGKALKHYCSVMVHFTMSESKKNFILDAAENVIGHLAGARIDKNKVAPPRRTCDFAINYTEGVINHNVEIGDLAIKYGVVERPTNTSYVYGDKKWVGKESFYRGILESDLTNELFIKVKEAKLNTPVVIEVAAEDFETEEAE